MGIIIPNRLCEKLNQIDDTYSCGKTWLGKIQNAIAKLDGILDSGKSPLFLLNILIMELHISIMF